MILVFENVSSNIICSRITGEKQLLELTLPITAENEKQCLEAYIKTGKLKVIIEVGEKIVLRQDSKDLYSLEWRKPDKQDIGKMCWFWSRSVLSQTELDGVRLHLIKANPDFKGLLADHGQIAPTEQDFIKVYGG